MDGGTQVWKSNPSNIGKWTFEWRVYWRRFQLSKNPLHDLMMLSPPASVERGEGKTSAPLPPANNPDTGSGIFSVMIRKIKSGEYRLYSRKKDAKTGKRRNLGTFSSLAAAKKHERAVQFFKKR